MVSGVREAVMKLKWVKCWGGDRCELFIADEGHPDDGVTMAVVVRIGHGKYTVEYWADTDPETDSEELVFKGSLPKAKALAFTLVRIT